MRTAPWPDKALLLLLAFALLVKSVVLGQLGGHPLLQPEAGLDGGAYVRLAERVASGDLLAGEEPFYLAPLYIYFLGLVFALSEHSLVAVRIVQVLLGTVAVGLTYATARHWYGENAGRIAGCLAAATGIITFNEVIVLQAALDVFLTALALYLTARALQGEGALPLLAAGAAWGLLALNRPNALVYPVVAVAALVVVRRSRAGLRGAAALALGLALALAPSAWRNHAVAGEWTLISSHGGLNFYLGNNPEADGTYHALPGITPSIEGQARDARRVAEAARARTLSERGVSHYFYARAWEWIRSSPVAALRLLARKVAYLLNAHDTALNYSYAYYSLDEPTLLRFLLVSPGLLVMLGIVGLALAPRAPGRRGFRLWAAFVPVHALCVAAFFVSGRYRLPLLVPLAIGGGGALAWGWDQLRSRGPKPLVPALALLAGIGILVHRDLGLDDGRSAERTEMILHLVDEGRDREARELLARAESNGAGLGMLYFRVGRALYQKGRTDEAVELLRKAVAAAPAEPAVHLSLGKALLDLGDREGAARHLLAARGSAPPEVVAFEIVPALAAAARPQHVLESLEALPATPLADTAEPARLAVLGGLALELDAPQVAEPLLRKVLERAPDLALAHEHLGMALAMTGRLAEATKELEEACRLDPASPGARLKLATVEARRGRHARARALAEEALRLGSDDPRALRLLEDLGARR